MEIQYKFKDESLLNLAMTQSGINAVHNNERLEFVGDRVLGLTVAAMLYEMFPTEQEGELARRFSLLVSTETLADVAIRLGVDKKLRHGHMTAGRIRHALADATEALIGAIFFDAGFDAAREFVLNIWRDLGVSIKEAPKDPKTKLQEMIQHAVGELPVYTCEQSGAPHNPEFVVTVTAMGKSASGRGSSKKEASTAAAEELMKKLAF